MRDLRLSELASHVVAWHNRHPLARRIDVSQLHSIGYVVLPFVAAGQTAPATPAAAAVPGAASTAEVGTLRERAVARAQSAAAAPELAATATEAPSAAAPAPAPSLQSAYSEDFMAPLAPAKVARWAARHGLALAAEPRDAPVRRIKPDAGADASQLQLLWLLTVQVESGRSRTRLLLGGGENPELLGRRLWSPLRLALLLAAVAALLAALAWVVMGRPLPPARPAAAPTAAANTASAASAPASAASAGAAGAAASSVVAAAAAAGTSASPAAASAASAAELTELAPATGAAAVERPLDVEPTLGRVQLPSLTPRIDARLRARQAALAPASAATTVAIAPAPSLPLVATPASTTAAQPRAQHWAVSTRLLRTRTEAEQVATAMRALLLGPGSSPMRVEVLPVGDDWRVVGMPFAQRAAADKARALLATRGMKAEIISF